MEKTINFNQSVNEICSKYPEMIDILKGLGFDALSPAMLATAGRFMTIPKGAKMKKLDLDEIKAELVSKGFTIEDPNG